MTPDKKERQQAEREAEQELAQLVKSSRSATDALESARSELAELERELGKRSTPYGKDLKQTRYPDISNTQLDARHRAYSVFVDELDKALVFKSNKEEIEMLDRAHTLEELKQIARQHGQSVSGTKHDLIRRILG